MDRSLATVDAEILEKATDGRSMAALGAAQPSNSSPGVRVRLFEDGIALGQPLAPRTCGRDRPWADRLAGQFDSGFMAGIWDSVRGISEPPS